MDTNSQITFLSPVEPNEDITSIKGLSADRSSKFLSLILENNKDQWLHPSEASQLPTDDILFETKELRNAKDRKIPPSSWNLSNNYGFGSEAVLNTPQSGFNYYDHQIAGHFEHALMTASDDGYHNETVTLVDLNKNDTFSAKQTTTETLNNYVNVSGRESNKAPNIIAPKDISERIDNISTGKPETLTDKSQPMDSEVVNKTEHIGYTSIMTNPKTTETMENKAPKEGIDKHDISERVISRIIYPAQIFPDLIHNETVDQGANVKPKNQKEAAHKETQLYENTNHSNVQALVSNVTEPGGQHLEFVISEKQYDNLVNIPQSKTNDGKKHSIPDQEKLPKETVTIKVKVINDSVETEKTEMPNVQTVTTPDKNVKPTTDTRGPLVDLSNVSIDYTNESEAMINNHTQTISEHLHDPTITAIPKSLPNNIQTSFDIQTKVSDVPENDSTSEKGKTIAKNSTDKSKDIVGENPISEINEPASNNLEHKMSYRTKQGSLAPQQLMLKSSEMSINSDNLHPASRHDKDHRTNVISSQTAEGRRRSEALDVGYQKRMGGNIRGIDPKDNEQPMFVEWLAKLRRQKQKRLKDSEKAKKWAIDKTFGIKSKSQPLTPTFDSQSFRPSTSSKYSPPPSQPCNETELETMQLAVKILTLLLRKVEKLSEPIRSNMQSPPRSFRQPLGTRRRYLLTPVDIVLPKNRKNFKQPVYPPTVKRDHLRRNPQKFYSENSVIGDNHRRNTKYFPGNSNPMEEKFHRTDRKYFSENPPHEQRNFEQRGNPKYFPNEQNPEGYPLEPPAEGQSSYSLGKGQYPMNYAYQ